MRRVSTAVALAAALVIGTGPPARADPAGPPVPAPAAGWSRSGGVLTWRAPERVPMGDAAVEFFAGDRPLGRPVAAADGRTFRLRAGAAGRRDDLRVWAGGRRLDVVTPPAGGRLAAFAPPALLPPNPADPGVKGPHATVTGEYSLRGIRLPGLPHRVEMRAVVVAPRGMPGARPLALFLHGRHATCYRGSDRGAVTNSWPCERDHRPVPSYRGYLQAQKLLASQGYVTVSISANGINGQDYLAYDEGAQARSSLVRTHLAHWADWAGAERASAPAIVRAAPRADLSKVFLMGHSRGGEGVSRATMDTLAPPPAGQDGYRGRVRWTIRGMLLIGPTSFGHNPVPDVPSTVILPGCDNDVADLQGQAYIDGTRGVGAGRALHSSLYVIGANHNFFNAEWTPGQSAAPSWDDFGTDDDPVCSPGRAARLTARQEQSAGATYIAAAARLSIGGDDRVRPLLDGSGVRARSADPARVLSQALGGGRTPAVLPAPGVRVTAGRICTQVSRDLTRSCRGRQSWAARYPHFVEYRDVSTEAGRYALELAWSSAGTPATVQPPHPADLTGARALALRLIVPPNTAGTRLGVVLVRPGGARTGLGDISLNGLPGGARTTTAWAQEVRIPLGGFRGRFSKIEFTPRTASGRAVLLDAWGWHPGTPEARAAPMPRLDLGVDHGTEVAAGARVLEVPARVTGCGIGRVRLFLVGGNAVVRSWVTDVRPGMRVIRVRATLRDPDRRYSLDAKAVRNALIGDDHGEIRVTGDGPAALPPAPRSRTMAPVLDPRPGRGSRVRGVESRMHGIGEIARASGLSISALRFYDGAGVLVPAEVDPVNGYRRYSDDQVRAARLVAGLRRIGMPVPDITRAVSELTNPPAVRKLLDEHLHRLEDGLADARRELSRVHALLDLQETALTRITLPAAALAAALGAVRFAACADPGLPILGGVLLETEPAALRTVATDRFRLAIAEAAAGVSGPPARVVAPLSFVDALRPLLTGGGPVVLELGPDGIGADVAGRSLEAKPLEVEFPDHRRLVDPGAAGARRVTVDVPALRAAVDAVPAVSREHEGKPFDLAILAVDPAGALRVAREDEWAADEQAHVAVNREFLLQALDAGGAGQLVLELDGPIKPLAVRGADSFSILMPVRR